MSLDNKSLHDCDYIDPAAWRRVIEWLRAGAPRVAPQHAVIPLAQFRRDSDQRFVTFCLESLKWNVSATAVALEISRSALKELMIRLEIRRPPRPPRRKARARRATGAA